MTLPQLLDLASKLGLPGTLIVILFAGYKDIWVWGSRLKQVERERDEWKMVALGSNNVADAVTEFAIRQRLAHDAALATSERRARIAEELNALPPSHGARRRVRR